MSKIDEKRLKKLCKLARLEVSPDETEKYLKLLNNDLETLEALDKINTDNILPLTNSYDMVLREYQDEVLDGNVAKELMECAPKELYNYFVVPKVMDK